MGINKIKYGDTVLIDLTQDTVSSENLQKNITAHGADGEIIIGELEPDKGQIIREETTNNTGLQLKIIAEDVTNVYTGKNCWIKFKKNTNITPVMTANVTGNYEAFASSEVTTPRQAWCAFDNISGDDQEANRWHGSANDLPGYIGMKFPEPVTIMSFKVKNADKEPHLGIGAFTLQGSNDGSVWEDCGSYTNPSDYAVETTYTPAKFASRQYWRLYITSTNYVSSGKSYCVIDEITFNAVGESVSFVLSDDPAAYPASGVGDDGLYYTAIGSL